MPDETAQEEILMTNEVITRITGEEVSYMRPTVWSLAEESGEEIGCHACVVDHRSAGLDNGQ